MRTPANELAHLEWLVAHRELQYLRACAKGSSRYARERGDKLDQAKRALDAQLRRMGRRAAA